jgi:hypothetical protein
MLAMVDRSWSDHAVTNTAAAPCGWAATCLETACGKPVE